MDEGTRAIITEISRKISDNQYEKIEKVTKERDEYLDKKIERTAKEQTEYLDKKFECLKIQVKEVKTVIDDIKGTGCVPVVNHITEHKEKEKRITRNVTIISTTIPTIILLGSWLKGMIIGWIQKPPTP